MKTIAVLIMNHFPHSWEQVVRIPYLATSFCGFVAHEMARVSDLLSEVLNSSTPTTFTFLFHFIGHPSLGAFIRVPYCTVGWRGGRRSYWSFCSQTWCAALGMRVIIMTVPFPSSVTSEIHLSWLLVFLWKVWVLLVVYFLSSFISLP